MKYLGFLGEAVGCALATIILVGLPLVLGIIIGGYIWNLLNIK